MKNLLLIALFALANEFSFAQEPPQPDPEPKTAEPVKQPEEIIYEIVDEPAEFTGGMGALRQYMEENLRYPETAKEKGLQGKCILQFVVSKNGYISNVKVKRGVADCPECDQEAIRLVKGMPKWVPGTIKGTPVNSIFNIPVSFRFQ